MAAADRNIPAAFTDMCQCNRSLGEIVEFALTYVKGYYIKLTENSINLHLFVEFVYVHLKIQQ